MLWPLTLGMAFSQTLIQISNTAALKSLNSSADDRELTGWQTLVTPGAAASLSAAQALPFPVVTNGIASTHFKISTLGLLSFDTGSANLGNTQPLPVPSMLFEKMNSNNGTGTVYTKVFGVAPQREFWILFSRYNWSETNTEITFAYVCKESTQKVYPFLLENQSLPLGIEKPLVFSFHIGNNNARKDTLFYLSGSVTPSASPSSFTRWRDDNVMLDLIPNHTSTGQDVHLVEVKAPKFVGNTTIAKKAIQLHLSLTPQSNAYAIELYGQYENEPAFLIQQINQLANKNLLQIEYVYSIPFPQIPIKKDNRIQKIKFWIKSASNNNKENDTITKNILVLRDFNSNHKQKSLVEYTTASWFEAGLPIQDKYISIEKGATVTPKPIFVANHAADGMSSADAIFFVNEIVGNTGKRVLNRRFFNDGNSLIQRNGGIHFEEDTTVLSNSESLPFIEIQLQNLNYNENAKTITGNIQAVFKSPFEGKLHLGAIIKEDDVRGLGVNFSQKLGDAYRLNKNSPYYNGAATTVGFYHQNVGWNYPLTFWGKPGTNEKPKYDSGDILQISFSQIMPSELHREIFPTGALAPTGNQIARFKPAQYSVVGFIAEFDSSSIAHRQILSCEEKLVWDNTANNSQIKNNSPILYPNPAKNKLYFSSLPYDSRIGIYSFNGLKILEDINANELTHGLDLSKLSAGIYFVKILDNTEMSIVKLIIE